jgi:hypothetical protein
MRWLLVENLRRRFSQFQSENKIDGAVRVLSRFEDLVLVLAKRLDPRANVGGVIRRVVWDASLGRQEDTGQFRSQFLSRVTLVAECFAGIKRVAVQT